MTSILSKGKVKVHQCCACGECFDHSSIALVIQRNIIAFTKKAPSAVPIILTNHFNPCKDLIPPQPSIKHLSLCVPKFRTHNNTIAPLQALKRRSRHQAKSLRHNGEVFICKDLTAI